MKTFIASIVLVAAAAIVLSSAAGADAPNRPPGVGILDWIPISDSLGIVLVRPATRPVDPTALLLAPPAEGYLMVKRAAGWRRLVIVEPDKGPGPAG